MKIGTMEEAGEAEKVGEMEITTLNPSISQPELREDCVCYLLYLEGVL